jgi:hypothetical protein
MATKATATALKTYECYRETIALADVGYIASGRVTTGLCCHANPPIPRPFFSSGR